MCVIHVNARSVRNKINAIECHLANLPSYPQLLCISESWLRPEEIDSIHITGYDYVDSFCRVNKIGGGVIVFSRNGFCVKKCSLVSQFQVEGEC